MKLPADHDRCVWICRDPEVQKLFPNYEKMMEAVKAITKADPYTHAVKDVPREMPVTGEEIWGKHKDKELVSTHEQMVRNRSINLAHGMNGARRDR